MEVCFNVCTELLFVDILIVSEYVKLWKIT